MVNTTTSFKNAISASTRRLKAKVELFEGSTLVQTFTQDDAIMSIDIERVGEDSKFFGFGVSHRVNVKLRDVTRALNISTKNNLKISLGVVVDGSTINYVSFPLVFVTEVNRDENTNALSITAYDCLNKSKTFTVDSLGLQVPYTIKNVIEAAGSVLGANTTYVNIQEAMLSVPLPSYAGDTWVSNGITFTRNGDGSLTLNGTNDGVNNSAFFFYNEVAGGTPLTLEVGETYTAADFEDEDIMFVFFTGTYYRKKDGQTFTATEDEHVFKQVYVQIPKGNTTTFDNYTIYPTLKKKATLLDVEYPSGANFEGSETLQEVLTAAAEATQTIYYMNSNNALVFKQLDKDGAAIKSITKNDYITLDSSTNRRLQTIASVTELGDNVSASTTQLGTTQYVRNNPFWVLREDIADLIENALVTIGNITINQFNCSWRGDFSLEVGDKIELTTKDNQTVISYLLNDTIKYDGGLSEASEWEYKETEAVTSNPTTLGEALKYTYAQVDKANKQIDIVASETSANSEAISALQINTDSISASVKKVEDNTQEALAGVNADISTLTNRVEATMTAEDVTLAIKSELDNGVSKVETTTGFKFDESGLTISKTGSEMTTNIDEDGMTITRDNEEVLVADHEGVKAYNLHANTYLIIGETSRFEDYDKDGETRTGCFWIGGAD